MRKVLIKRPFGMTDLIQRVRCVWVRLARGWGGELSVTPSFEIPRESIRARERNGKLYYGPSDSNYIPWNITIRNAIASAKSSDVRYYCPSKRQVGNESNLLQTWRWSVSRNFTQMLLIKIRDAMANCVPIEISALSSNSLCVFNWLIVKSKSY